MLPTINCYQNLLDHLDEVVYCVDMEKKIIFWNKAAERLSGFGTPDVIGKSCQKRTFTYMDEHGRIICNDKQCPAVKAMHNGQIYEEKIYLHHKDGYRVPVVCRITPLRNAKGQVFGAVEMFGTNFSATASRREIEKLQNLVLLDPLTALGNRRYAETNLYGRFDEMQRYGWPFGVLFIDIDYFKKINDRFGHDVGDCLLKRVANTLSKSVRSLDIVCRWGGDEFIAFIINIHEEERLYTIAQKCRTHVEESRLSVGSDTIQATISIGATLANHNDTVETLIKRVDQLMYHSKTSGRNRVTLHFND